MDLGKTLRKLLPAAQGHLGPSGLKCRKESNMTSRGLSVPGAQEVPNRVELSGTGDSQRDSRESIRANHSQLTPLFLQRVRPIRTNHATKELKKSQNS